MSQMTPLTLTTLDFHNILRLHRGQIDAFMDAGGLNSLARCRALGILRSDEITLTREGVRKAELLESHVETLKHGVPLSVRVGDKAESVYQDDWYRFMHQGKPVYCTRSLLVSRRILERDINRKDLSDDHVDRLHKFVGSSATKSLQRLVPFAYQISSFPGIETVVFKGQESGRDRGKRRLMSSYLVFSWMVTYLSTTSLMLFSSTL